MEKMQKVKPNYRDSRNTRSAGKPQTPKHSVGAPVRTVAGDQAFVSRPASKRAPGHRNAPQHTGGERKTSVNYEKISEKVEEPRFTAQPTDGKNTKFFIEPKLRIISIGGNEETGGKNMMVMEYKNDIIIVDAGLMFPDQDMPGIDFVIPDVSYLEQNKHKIRGLIVTHGHLDHIGAIPYIYEKLGSPAIYSSPLAIGLIRGKMEEFGLAEGAKLNTIKVGEDILQLGVFKVRSFRLTHSIPQAMGFAIDTPEGLVIHTGDWKFDHTPADGKPVDFSQIAMLGGEKPIALICESTNVEKPGVSISEREIEETLFKIMDQVKGRLIIATFSLLISRIQQILNVAKKFDRKVTFIGRSMVQSYEIATSLGALIVPPDTVIDVHNLKNYPDNKIIIICTGSQGEDRAALTSIALGEHRQIKIKRGDTTVLSASPIPGNERSVSEVMDNLYRAGSRVIYQKLMDVHTSGHAKQEDLKLMIALIRPKYLIPNHGERHRLMLLAQIAQDMGIVDEEHCLVADNGQVMEFSNGKASVTNKRVPASYVMVDGLGVGDVGNIVLRDRKAMAQDGIFVIIVTVDHKTGEVVTSPDIISRGFIYMRENEQLVHKSRAEIKRLFAKHAEAGGPQPDWNVIKQKIRDEIGEFLYTETERRPMVIPVVIEV